MSGIRFIQTPDKTHPYAVIYKDAGIASAPLTENECDTAFNLAAERFPELMNVQGKKFVEHGLIHRIDTPTKGLLLIASTQAAYTFFTAIQKKGLFEKKYRASSILVDNDDKTYPESRATMSQMVDNYKRNLYDDNSNIVIESRFRSFGPGHKLVRPVTEKSGKKAAYQAAAKKYRTEVSITGLSEEKIETVSTIKEGFRHQVRCHLAWIGLPVVGDKLYNPHCLENDIFSFEAFYLKFPDPLFGNYIEYTV